MSATRAQRFLHDAAIKSADLVHREIIRHGIDSYDAAVLRGRARFKDWQSARRGFGALHPRFLRADRAVGYV